LDGLGRPIRWFWHGPEPEGKGAQTRVMQEITYDALGEHVARRSVPTREDAPLGERYADIYAYDAAGREVWRTLEDPDPGTTVTAHDGFGEVVSSTDALGRVVAWEYDGLGRTQSRVDQQGAERLTTTWTWDKADHGVGRLEAVSSPDGDKTYTYTSRGQLETLTLAVVGSGVGSGEALSARLGYDDKARVETITYPTRSGAAPFVVRNAYDTFGHTLAVRDDATRFPYWRLTDVDEAGRTHGEAFGNDISTQRGYFADRQALKSIATTHGATAVQALAYTYDDRLSRDSRTDALQAMNPTERFRYDGLERVTCAYWSPAPDPFASCANDYPQRRSGSGQSHRAAG
jgi:YD repeat-containing protein